MEHLLNFWIEMETITARESSAYTQAASSDELRAVDYQ